MKGKTINGFTLQHLLGMGGMAEVWFAENAIGKKAAVKLLLPKLCADEAIVARFQNEAKVMVKLDHPNIRQVYDYGSIDGRPSIVMEYLEGDDLKALMKRGRRFTDEELRKWWNQITDALNYTHAQGIVHRDIKPSNIFLDQKGNVKLLDFGIAKIRESISMTQTGAMMGTLMYMSPEQVRDSKHIGPESDVYSLAVSFVYLLSGKKPYDSDTSSDYDIRKGIVEIPLDLTGVPAHWQGFLTPYLEKDPAKRPALRPFEATAPSSGHGSGGFAIRPEGNGALRSPSDDEGTMVSNAPSPKSAPKESLSNGNRHSGPSFRENGTLSHEPKDKPKSKKGLWIGLGAVVVAAIAAFLFLRQPQPAPTDPETEAFLACQTVADYQAFCDYYGMRAAHYAEAQHIIDSLVANGHGWVDLGLPSGTLWATCNIGADKPEDFGDYFAWGETKPQSSNTNDWSTYKYANGEYNKLTKYCSESDYGNNGFTDNLTELQGSDDPATANWGGGWRTPSNLQWDELLQNTNSQWTTKNGVAGRLFTSKKNGQTIFLPAASGYRGGTSLDYAVTLGNYWSSSLQTEDPNLAWNLYFVSGYCGMDYYYRSGGLSVRPVRSAAMN